MNVHLHIDFETCSAIDLKACGLDVYSKHPSTDVWCMAWTLDGGPVNLWKMGEPFPFVEEDYAQLRGGVVVAHNAPFELAIWNQIMAPRYGWPELKPEQVQCTMAMSYAMALPGSLENASAAVGIEERKDQAGRRVMMQLSKPREVKPDGTIIWWDDPAKLDKLYAYCRQDVEVERQLHRRLLALSNSEAALWQLDYRINQRGIFIDRHAVQSAIKMVQAEQARLNGEMHRVTGGAVSTCSAVGQLGDWIRYRGVEMPGVAKADVLDALSGGDLPEDVRDALHLRREAAKSSTAKLKGMLDRAGPDGRVRGMFQYHGASTGRWAGRGIQLHNLPRPNLEQPSIEDAIDHIGDAEYLNLMHGSPLDVVSSCLRGFITAAPGHDLIAADFANIEGRVLAWLAGEEWKLQAFRDFDAGIGADIYLLTYAKSFGLDVKTLSKKSPVRQVGKVEELAFGFGGGVGAWRTMEKAYRPPAMTDNEVNDIKNRWRDAHPAIADYDDGYWAKLDEAAISAVLNGGQVFEAGAAGRRIRFKVKGSFLWCQLPSGRLLCYPYPRVVETTTPWGKVKDTLTFRTELIGEARKKAKIIDDPLNGGNWFRVSTYGGSLSENVTQAVARDLLAEGMVRIDPKWPVVMHVHDEIVVEINENATHATPMIVENEMKKVPKWATGLPIAVEGWRGRRYRKG